jgi:superoxide dismutase, Fe-Mn family
MNRREILNGMGGLLALGLVGPKLQAQGAPQAAGGWPIKPLPFDPKKLKGLSEKLIVSHHDNNYAGAARRIGQIQQMLAGLPANAPGFQVKGLKMEELIATNSAILHEEYFGNLGGDGKASGTLQQAISSNLRDGKLHNYIAFDHTDNVAFGRPILVNDMFEHAYHMDYGSNAAMYVDAFMQNVNWDEANRRYEEARTLFAALKT